MDDQATAVSVRTAEAILRAARSQFTHFGYDGIGLRAIADLAGVNVALIGRYFGSKEGLFLAAVPPKLDIRALLAGPMSTFGTRAAAIMDMKSTRGFDPMMALVRVAASPDCAPALRTALDEQVISPLAMRLDGDHPQLRAGMVMSVMAGYEMMSRTISIDALRDAAGEQRRLWLAALIQQIVDTDTVDKDMALEDAKGAH